MRVVCFVFFVHLLFSGLGNAQSFMRPGNTQILQETQSTPANNDNPEWNLPPLPTLINLALENSQVMKLADTEIQMGTYELKDVYRDWMERISFMTDARYGTMFNYSMLVATPGAANTSTRMWSYGVGAMANMSLSDIFDRKRTKQKARLRVEQSRIHKEEAANALTQLVITAYYDVIAAQKTLALSNEISLTTSLVHDKAKMDFSQNRISLADFSKENEAFLTAQNNVELQKINLMKTIRILEIIVGVELVK